MQTGLADLAMELNTMLNFIAESTRVMEPSSTTIDLRFSTNASQLAHKVAVCILPSVTIL